MGGFVRLHVRKPPPGAGGGWDTHPGATSSLYRDQARLGHRAGQRGAAFRVPTSPARQTGACRLPLREDPISRWRALRRVRHGSDGLRFQFRPPDDICNKREKIPSLPEGARFRYADPGRGGTLPNPPNRAGILRDAAREAFRRRVLEALGHPYPRRCSERGQPDPRLRGVLPQEQRQNTEPQGDSPAPQQARALRDPQVHTRGNVRYIRVESAVARRERPCQSAQPPSRGRVDALQGGRYPLKLRLRTNTFSSKNLL